MTSGAEILARIQPTLLEESVEIVMGNKLIVEWEQLQEQLEESREQDRRGNNRLVDKMVDSKTTLELAEQIAAVEEKMVTQAIKVTFRSMTKDKWRATADNHPPRQGDLMDAHAGYDRDAMLDDAVRICMIDPVFEACSRKPVDGVPCEHTDCGSWEQFESVVPPGQWERLKETVNSANRGVVDAPKSELASRILRRRVTI